MIRKALTISAMILAVLLVRAVFKNRVPKRMIYALWLVVLVKLCLPGTVVSLPVLPAEEVSAPVQRAETPARTAPVVQQPAQAAAQPQTPVQQPVTPIQETAKPAAKPLTATQIFQTIWASGSALLGLWLLGTWLVFTVRLHKSRRFLGRRGRTRIYTSSAVKSPCLAGLIPAVYLTEDVPQTNETELILRHELTHLRHLDFLWSFCRTAAVIAYWWNPFIWLAAILSKRDAELACDEAVAAGLSDAQRLAYARAILAQAPRKRAALSLAGPPVKERILFLTKKQRTSILCIILALVLTLSVTGCAFAELTRQKSGEITLPQENAPVTAEPANTPEPADTPTEQEEPADIPVEQEAPVQEPPQLVNDGSYDTSQPLQDWELARTNGVQTGMTQAQVEAITGPLTENENGVLMDSQNISYDFWDRSESESEPKLTEMIWIANVENDELVYTTSQDAPAFRGICLGDTIDEVFDQFPCTDRELKRWQTQYVYGYEGADNYAALHFIADSFYTLDFYIQGQWRVSIDFSRVQQRVFQIQIYGETYWQDISQPVPVNTRFLRDAALRDKMPEDLSQIPDDELLTFLQGAECALPDNGFTFESPSELSSEQLFRLFLWWTNRATLDTYQEPDDGLFYFPDSTICRTLNCYFNFSLYAFDITQCTGYDAQSGMVIDRTASVSPGTLRTRMVSKTTDGHEVTYTVDLYLVEDGLQVQQTPFVRKEYTLLCYPGAFFIESARVVPMED